MIAVQHEPGALVLSSAHGEVLRAHAEARLSDGRILSTREAGAGLRWSLEHAPAHGRHPVLRLHLRNTERRSLRVEQLRLLVAPDGYRRLALDALRLQQTGWQSWSRAHPPAPFAPNIGTAAPPIRGPYLPHRRSDSQVDVWMTVLCPAPDQSMPALLLGFLSARDQLGTIEIGPAAGSGHWLVASTELDGFELRAGEEIASEPLLLAEGSPADLLDTYVQAVATEMLARPSRAVQTGWCSWYQLYTDVSEADVERNVESLAAERERLPLDLIQLDDGYQHAVGDWLEVLPKFPSGMPRLVERVRARGYQPGVWLAPFLLSARSHTYASHPDWVVRDERGEPLLAIDNWGAPHYAVDTTQPAVLDWLAGVVRTVCEEWGFEYLKLDFLYAAAMRGRRFDASATAVQAYRRGLECLRRAAGERFILGCGAPLLPSIGLVDGMRIGSDVAAYWGREGNADGPSLRNATRATLARLWMHGRWWTNDPDCLVVRATDTALSLAEVQGWASVVALSGGMLFVGDDVSRVEPSRLELLSRLLPPSGQAATASGRLVELMPSRLHLRVERPWANWSVVGLANWSDVPVASVTFEPAEWGLDGASPYHLVDLWSGAYLGATASAFELGSLDAHAVRVLAVTPAGERPQTIGSTGHLLGHLMDLADERWDPASRTLVLQPSGVGPRARRGELLVYDPHGPLRRVPFATAGPSPIRLEF